MRCLPGRQRLSAALHQKSKEGQIKKNDLTAQNSCCIFSWDDCIWWLQCHVSGPAGNCDWRRTNWHSQAQICGIWENFLFHLPLNPPELKSRSVWQPCDVNWVVHVFSIHNFDSRFLLLRYLQSSIIPVPIVKSYIIPWNLHLREKLALFFTEPTGKTWLPGLVTMA